jgi:hypothetical protein
MKFLFMTPQILQNDIARGVVPMDSIRLMIFDEAHRATGDHAYVQVVNQVWEHHKDFRILALSATPGKDGQRIYEVTETCNALKSLARCFQFFKFPDRFKDDFHITKFIHINDFFRLPMYFIETKLMSLSLRNEFHFFFYK